MRMQTKILHRFVLKLWKMVDLKKRNDQVEKSHLILEAPLNVHQPFPGN